MTEFHKNVEGTYGDKLEKASTAEKADFSHLRSGDLVSLKTSNDQYYIAVLEGLESGKSLKVCFYSNSQPELKVGNILGASLGGSSLMIDKTIRIGMGLNILCENRSGEFTGEYITPPIESFEFEYSSENAEGMIKENLELDKAYQELSPEQRDGETYSYSDVHRGDMIVVQTQNTTYKFIAVEPGKEGSLEVIAFSDKDSTYRKASLEGAAVGQHRMAATRWGKIVKGMGLSFSYHDSRDSKGSFVTSGVVSVEKIGANDETEEILEKEDSLN